MPGAQARELRRKMEAGQDGLSLQRREESAGSAQVLGEEVVRLRALLRSVFGLEVEDEEFERHLKRLDSFGLALVRLARLLKMQEEMGEGAGLEEKILTAAEQVTRAYRRQARSRGGKGRERSGGARQAPFAGADQWSDAQVPGAAPDPGAPQPPPDLP